MQKVLEKPLMFWMVGYMLWMVALRYEIDSQLFLWARLKSPLPFQKTFPNLQETLTRPLYWLQIHPLFFQ